MLERGAAALGDPPVESEVLATIAETAAGDARHALSTLELAHEHAASRGEGSVSEEDVAAAVMRRPVRYDRDGDNHYDTISAFIKSVRASDPDAALFYLAVMLEGGEDPVYIARRIAILASEDIGNADPRALELAVACARVVELVGLPECRYALSQATAYLSMAPKSNSAATSLGAAPEARRAHATARPPAALRDASYRGAEQLGSGVGYRYPHDAPGAFVADDHLPPELAGTRIYEPSEHGLEAKLAERLRELRRLRNARRSCRASRGCAGRAPSRSARPRARRSCSRGRGSGSPRPPRASPPPASASNSIARCASR